MLSIGISCYEYWGLDSGPGVFFEPIGIFIAILLATGLAFIFELKADKEFSLLNQVNDDEPVQVIRQGGATTVPRKDVVVGDIVVLNTGEEVPADGELLEATSLNIDESTLTGEPVAHKTTDPEQFDKDATFASNTAMKGTKVMEGHGVMRVTAVGDATENGKVFEAAQIDDSVKTPLNEQLDGLGCANSSRPTGNVLYRHTVQLVGLPCLFPSDVYDSRYACGGCRTRRSADGSYSCTCLLYASYAAHQ